MSVGAAREPAPARGSFLRNAAALYAVGFNAYLFPLVTAPYLARVLHPDGWGRVALAQSVGQSLAVVVEYGFVLSATREVARAAPAERAAVLASVLGAKAVLAGLVLALGVAVSGRLPVIGGDHWLVWSAVLWAVAQGLHPLWYFQGREEVRPVVVLDVLASALAIAGVLVLCRQPDDAWKVLALQAASALLVALAGHGLAIRALAPRWPSWDAVRRRLTDGAGLFAYRLAVSAYTVANPLVLGLVAPATVVGYFAAAEKLVKTLFVAAIHPLNQALYPRASRGAVVGGRMLAAFAIAGTAGGALIALAAPWLLAIVFGRDYAPATAPLRILALLLPILSVSTALVMHRMLPGARDRLLLAITVAAGALNVALAVVLAPAYGAVGMAVAVVTVESAVLLAVARAVRSRP